MKGYLNITKPLSLSEVTLKPKDLERILKEIDPTGDEVLSN